MSSVLLNYGAKQTNDAHLGIQNEVSKFMQMNIFMSIKETRTPTYPAQNSMISHDII